MAYTREGSPCHYLIEKFRPFVLGAAGGFMVRTNRGSLKWLLEAKTGRLQRWALRLSEYGPFEITHRSGPSHTNVDAFTRSFAESEALPDCAFVNAISYAVSLLPSDADLKHAQASCKSCDTLLKTKKAVVRDEIIGIGRHHRWRPVVPVTITTQVAHNLHASIVGAHIGARKLLSALSRKFILPNGIDACEKAIQSCQSCMPRKPPQRKLGTMRSSPPSTPWSTVALDFCGPYPPSESGMRYVLVITDQFTKWVELVPTVDQPSLTVVQVFYERVICRHGCPLRVLSDNGPQFRSTLVGLLCKYFGMQKTFSSAYYPQGDGYAERMMRASLCKKDTTNWDRYVPGIMFAYKSTEHEATNHSAFELNTGRIARWPGERLDNIKANPNATKYVKNLRNTITAAHERARRCVNAYWSRMKAAYDKKRKDSDLQPEDSVLVLLNNHERAKYPCRKLAPRWSKSAKILERLSNGVTYRVRRADDDIRSVHVSHLLPLDKELWGDPSLHYT